METRLKRNRIKCLKCGDIIESKHVHDFKFCSCGNIFVDGGLEYSRIGGTALDDDSYENLCEFEVIKDENRI